MKKKKCFLTPFLQKYLAPTAYRFIRNYDRRINVVNGRMSYPEMYVLDAGYKKFFETSEVLSPLFFVFFSLTI